MKLISLHIFKYQKGDSILLSSAVDLSHSGVLNQNTVENITKISRSVSGCVKPSGTAPNTSYDLEEGNGNVHCLTFVDKISVTAITDKEYPVE